MQAVNQMQSFLAAAKDCPHEERERANKGEKKGQRGTCRADSVWRGGKEAKVPRILVAECRRISAWNIDFILA